MEMECREASNGHVAFPLFGNENLPVGVWRDDQDELPATDHSCEACDREKNVAQLMEVAERYRARFLWLAARIANRREDAEDILQQALLKAYLNLSKFRGDSKMRTWLTAIVQNTAREYVRSSRRRVFVSLECTPYREGGIHEELELPDPAMGPDERYERMEKVDILYGAINRMSESNQHLLQMCLLEEMPYEQVASRLNTRLSTIKSRVFRCKHLLRAATGDCFGQVE